MERAEGKTSSFVCGGGVFLGVEEGGWSGIWRSG